jgi:hypothetical protein
VAPVEECGEADAGGGSEERGDAAEGDADADSEPWRARRAAAGALTTAAVALGRKRRPTALSEALEIRVLRPARERRSEIVRICETLERRERQRLLLQTLYRERVAAARAPGKFDPAHTRAVQAALRERGENFKEISRLCLKQAQAAVQDHERVASDLLQRLARFQAAYFADLAAAVAPDAQPTRAARERVAALAAAAGSGSERAGELGAGLGRLSVNAGGPQGSGGGSAVGDDWNMAPASAPEPEKRETLAAAVSSPRLGRLAALAEEGRREAEAKRAEAAAKRRTARRGGRNLMSEEVDDDAATRADKLEWRLTMLETQARRPLPKVPETGESVEDLLENDVLADHDESGSAFADDALKRMVESAVLDTNDGSAAIDQIDSAALLSAGDAAAKRARAAKRRTLTEDEAAQRGASPLVKAPTSTDSAMLDATCPSMRLPGPVGAPSVVVGGTAGAQLAPLMNPAPPPVLTRSPSLGSAGDGLRKKSVDDGRAADDAASVGSLSP